MDFKVTRLSQWLVAPSEPTPSGMLSISWLDELPSNQALISTLHVFKHGEDPSAVISRALAKALVPYYPLAGIFVVSEQGKLQVSCTGDGAWFIKASANCTLADINYLEKPLLISQDELLPLPRPGLDPRDTMMLMQVTEFMCGGFVIGLSTNHAVVDGTGAAQFIHAIGDFARGLARPTVKPIWCRDLLPMPKNIKPKDLPPTAYNATLVASTVDVSLDRIKLMKKYFIEKTNNWCSTFDVVVAKAWQSRVRAIRVGDDTTVNLCFPISIRHLLHGVFPPGGYYGNCVYFVKVSAPSGFVANESFHKVVNMIKEAKERVPVEYFKWINGEIDEDPCTLATLYETFFVVDFNGLGFLKVDYGWGLPVNFFSVTQGDHSATCLIFKPPAPKLGVRLATKCIKKGHLHDFLDQMRNFSEVALQENMSLVTTNLVTNNTKLVTENFQ